MTTPTNTNSTTPRTDFAFDGDLSVGVLPEILTWEEAKGFARQLESELQEARKQAALYNKDTQNVMEQRNQLQLQLNSHEDTLFNICEFAGLNPEGLEGEELRKLALEAGEKLKREELTLEEKLDDYHRQQAAMKEEK